MKKLLIVKPTLDKNGYPVIPFEYQEKMLKRLRQFIGEKYEIFSMPFDSMLVVGEDNIDQLKDIKITSYDDIKKILEEV